MGAMEYLKELSLARVRSLNYAPASGLEEPTLAFYATLVAMIFMAVFVLLKLQQPRRNLPPSPPGAWPIVGHLPLLGKLPHITMENWAKQYGDIFLLQLGSIPTVVISSPEMAREVLLTQDKTWASRPTRKISAIHFAYNYKGIAFAPYSPMWRQLRRIATLELLTVRRLEASHGVRVEEMQQMVWLILQDAKPGKPVDVKLRLNTKLANEIFRMVLGYRFSGPIRRVPEDDQEAKAHEFKEMIHELQQLKGLFMAGDFVPWLRPLDIGGIEKRMKVVQARVDIFLNEVLAEHEVKWRKGPIAESDKDMVDVLLRTMHEQDEKEPSKLDEDCIKATVMNMISAGVDTSSVTMEWSMAEIIRNPNVQRKLTLELDTVVGKDRMVQEADLPNLKYLQAVIKEVFRLRPPAALLLPHESIQDCELAGYHVPAGSRLFVNAHAIGRNSKAWENPLDFDPERFMSGPEIDVRGQNFGLLPFGSGRRACPAITLAMVSVEWTIAMLFHAFEWSPAVGESLKDLDMKQAFGITTPRANTLFLHASPRLPTELYSA